MGGEMSPGDLVTLCPELYPRHKGKLGILIERAPMRRGVQWIVMINNRINPYYVDEGDMTNESR